ncbi:hypothetical protein HanRHA438_Chr17g0803951 [Helianthus annuus]|nr:hypothetical protein HanRHA438_Chr17g0803951 [Helianthus annuus]
MLLATWITWLIGSCCDVLSCWEDINTLTMFSFSCVVRMLSWVWMCAF